MEECYICYDSTTMRSPCVCRAPLCNDCYIEYLGYSDKCTICDTEFRDPDLINATCIEDIIFILFIFTNFFLIILFGSILISIGNKNHFTFVFTIQSFFFGIVIDLLVMWVISHYLTNCTNFIKNYFIYLFMRIRYCLNF